MKVLVACEYSGRVRDAFIARGHDAISVDLLPSEAPGPHWQGDIREFPELLDYWDLLIAFPDCTFLSGSGLHWNGRRPGRDAKTDEALDFVRWLMKLPIKRKCIENPVGAISSRIRKPFQIIQPYEFGDDASKKTCLWLDGLMPLRADPLDYVEPRWVNGLPRWANQTDSGQNRLPPSETRALDRAKTYPGIARAMASQWG